MNLTLVRRAYLTECTLGTLYAGALRLHTLEEAWIADQDGPGGQRREPGKRESCAPDGSYVLVPHNSPKHPNVWCLVNTVLGVYRWPGDIPAGQKYGRATILIHAGNTVGDIEGCCLVGLSQGRIDGKDAVLESRKALDQLRVVLGTDTHRLEIRPFSGTAEVAA